MIHPTEYDQTKQLRIRDCIIYTMSKPCIITVAITGSVARKSHNPAVPESVDEQIESTHEAVEAGASLVHMHSRDDDGAPGTLPDKFAEFQVGVKKYCPGIMVQFSTGGRSGKGSERGSMLQHRPDMASLSMLYNAAS